MKLSTQMVRMLGNIKNGYGSHGAYCKPRERGGRYATVRALRHRGFVNDDGLTESGIAALEVARQQHKQKQAKLPNNRI